MPARTNNVKHEGWYFCGRCGKNYPVGTLMWQAAIGSLRCPECYDPPGLVIPAERDARIARALAYVPRGGEPEVEPKLTQPPQFKLP